MASGVWDEAVRNIGPQFLSENILLTLDKIESKQGSSVLLESVVKLGMSY